MIKQAELVTKFACLALTKRNNAIHLSAPGWLRLVIVDQRPQTMHGIQTRLTAASLISYKIKRAELVTKFTCLALTKEMVQSVLARLAG